MKTIFVIAALAVFAVLVFVLDVTVPQAVAIIVYGLFMRLAGLVDDL